MDELCELNIFRNNNNNYLFSRYNFIQLLGIREEIENIIYDGENGGNSIE